MKSVDYCSIAQRIHYFRTQLGMTQESLADKTGISISQLGRIERGDRKPSLSILIRIANALQVSVDDLLADNLTAPMKGKMDPEYNFLLDCSPAENDILLRTANVLKQILRTHIIIK